MTATVVIANPIAGSGRGRLSGPEACALLRGRGIEARFQPTGHAGHARELAREAAQAGASLVVAVGGDGTVHEVAAGLVGTETALGVLPSGSGNDFARAVGCFTRPTALEALTGGRDLAFDSGRLDGDLFVNSLGLLASGMVSLRASRLWRRLGGVRYSLASAMTLLSYFGDEVIWKLEDGAGQVEIREGRYLLAEICNTPFTGGGFRFAPDAHPADGRLDACLIRSIAPWTAMRQLPKAAGGGRLDHPAISVSPFRRLEFMVSRPVGYHRDGEPGMLEAGTHAVDIVEKSLLVRVPADWDGSCQ